MEILEKCGLAEMKKSESGQAIVEFSLVSVILLMLMGGVIDGARVMRYQIIMNGAVTEVVNQITIKEYQDDNIKTVCDNVLNLNYQYELGDGKTSYRYVLDTTAPDNITYTYHDYFMQSSTWSGKRNSGLVTVEIEREVELLTPFGRLIFGDAGGGKRLIKTSASTRIYTD